MKVELKLSQKLDGRSKQVQICCVKFNFGKFLSTNATQYWAILTVLTFESPKRRKLAWGLVINCVLPFQFIKYVHDSML